VPSRHPPPPASLYGCRYISKSVSENQAKLQKAYNQAMSLRESFAKKLKKGSLT
jgi:hypothetical protein